MTRPGFGRKELIVARGVVIGGGASGVLAVAALHRADPTMSIVLVGRDEIAGPGLAYGRAMAFHRLNSPAGRMGVAADDPAGFVAWCAEVGEPVEAADFVPRPLYGRYLAAVFEGLVAESEGLVTFRRGEALGVVEDAEHAVLTLADGGTIEADFAVLALGNPAPVGRDAGISARRRVRDPWATGALDGVGGRVLLVGTGLTAVDVAMTIARADPDASITATSRALLLPRRHLTAPAPAGPGLPDGTAGLSGVLRAFRQRLATADAAGAPWQAEVDGIRPQVNTLWQTLSLADRRRFVAHVSRHWEVHRHRMSPAVAAELDGLLSSGRLRLDATPTGPFDVVVDCTGPQPIPSRGWNPLVDSLLDSGAAVPDELGAGFMILQDGRLVGASGAPSVRLYVLGPARRGTQWESTAIPEIRMHAAELAVTVGTLG